MVVPQNASEGALGNRTYGDQGVTNLQEADLAVRRIGRTADLDVRAKQARPKGEVQDAPSQPRLQGAAAAAAVNECAIFLRRICAIYARRLH